tara:strand:+ start:58792 stop:59271 length:480 start_codon:yes stop_codon:yes gene_type:complete
MASIQEKQIRNWKKVYENDLESIVLEMKESLSSPCVILLSGEVGTGKTTFVRKFVSIMDENGKQEVASPTYSIVNEMGSIVHADLYRLKSPEELLHLEIPLYLEDKEFFLIEWARTLLNQLREFIPEDFLYYELKIDMNDQKADQDVASRNYELVRLEI